MQEQLTTETLQKAPERVFFIDYLKAFCVILVVFTHYEWSDKATPEFVFLISLAVPFFMIITGYNFTASALRKNETSLSQMLSIKGIFPRLKRFLIPFLMAYGVEMFGMSIGRRGVSLKEFLFGLVSGGYGPGSYYVPLMIQMLVVFPFVFYCVKKWDKAGVILVTGMNLLYEFLVWQLNLDKGAYRLLLFRYLILIAFGSYYYIHRREKIKKSTLIVAFTVGTCYLLAFTRGYRPSFCQYWTKTCVISALYFIVLFYLLFEAGKHLELKNRLGSVLCQIGKASYHIFLVQMVFYQLKIYELYTFLPTTWEVTFNVIFCLIGGLTFYYGEQDLIRQRERMGYLWNWRYYLRIRL